jgi:outer membrane protein TolC
MKRRDSKSARMRWTNARHDERTMQTEVAAEVAAEVFGVERAAEMLASAREELAALATGRGAR